MCDFYTIVLELFILINLFLLIMQYVSVFIKKTLLHLNGYPSIGPLTDGGISEECAKR